MDPIETLPHAIKAAICPANAEYLVIWGQNKPSKKTDKTAPPRDPKIDNTI